MRGSAAFQTQYGVEPMDLNDRMRAVSLLTRVTAALDEVSATRSAKLCALLMDLESGASDEVLLTGFERVAVALAQDLVALYDVALLLGIERVNDLMARVQDARMRPQGFGRPSAAGLVKLPQ
jgi:hypothetical protein